MDEITCCRNCQCKNIETFFDLGYHPFANALVRDQTAEDAKYPLSVSWCPECSLVQLNQTADPEELFSQYIWVTSTSSTTRTYAETFCEAVLHHANPINRDLYVLEIASNDGTFLKPFIRRGYQVLGVDPAENIVKMACSEGVPTICGFFGTFLAESLVTDHGFPRVIIIRNVLPHVASLQDFVKGIRMCMKDDSLLVIEVHYSKAILEELQYDSIYHEHVCYFSLKSLERLLNRYDLHIYDIMPSPISGGSIVVFVHLSHDEKTSAVLEYEQQEEIGRVNDFASWKRFAETADMHRRHVVQLLDRELSNGYTVVGYGASARSSTMLNFCGVGTERLKMIADQNLMKHKLFTPGTHIPIYSPETILAVNPDTVMILAWNFLDEIVSKLREQFHFRGNLLIPFPYPPKLVTIQEIGYG